MLESKDLIRIEKNFSAFNLMLAGMLVIYYLMFGWFNQPELAPNKMLFGASIFVLLMDFLLGKCDFFHTDFLIKIIKFCELLLFGGYAFFGTGISLNLFIAGVLYSLISLQTLIAYDVTEGFSKVAATIFNFIPLLFIMLYSLFLQDSSNFRIFINCIFLFVIVISQLIFVEIFSEVVVILYGKLASLNELLSTKREENDTMKNTQEKLVSTNEQLSIQRFRLQQANEQITRKNKETQLLNYITQNATSSLDINKLLQEFITNTFYSLKLDFCFIGIINQDEQAEETFMHRILYSENSGFSKRNVDAFDIRFVTEYINKSEPTEIPELANLALDCLNGTKIKSALLCPVVLNENASALYVAGSTQENFLEENKVFLNNLARQISLAFNNALLYSKMHTLAVKDALTGIYNRQYFNGIYSKLKHDEFDKERILTVVLFDIDKFKNINDTYGHVFGDEVIRYCGHMALKYSKGTDSFAVRYGGEEFVMVFPDKTTKEVLEICQNMHNEIKSKTFSINEVEVHINISLGIASYPENCDTIDNLTNSADMAMYVSKKNGRGRITIYEKSMQKESELQKEN